MMVILNRWLGDFICFGKFCCFSTVACTQQPISQRRKTSFYDEVWLVKTHADSTALENFSLQQQIANSLSSWVWDCRQETLWREAIMTTNSSDSNVQRGPWKAGQSLRALCHEASLRNNPDHLLSSLSKWLRCDSKNMNGGFCKLNWNRKTVN